MRPTTARCSAKARTRCRTATEVASGRAGRRRRGSRSGCRRACGGRRAGRLQRGARGVPATAAARRRERDGDHRHDRDHGDDRGERHPRPARTVVVPAALDPSAAVGAEPRARRERLAASLAPICRAGHRAPSVNDDSSTLADVGYPCARPMMLIEPVTSRTGAPAAGPRRRAPSPGSWREDHRSPRT